MPLCQLKEEGTANSSILAAIKAAEEAVLQDIGNLKVNFYVLTGSSLCAKISANKLRIPFLEMRTWKISQTKILRVFYPSFQ